MAGRLEKEFRARNIKVELLDGDEEREILSKGMGYSKEDPYPNIGRIAFVCHLLTRNSVPTESCHGRARTFPKGSIRRLPQWIHDDFE